MKQTMKFKLALVASAILMASSAMSSTLRWTSASDIPTLDIHSQNNALGNGVHAAIYESLVYYNSRTFKVEPQLATVLEVTEPNAIARHIT